MSIRDAVSAPVASIRVSYGEQQNMIGSKLDGLPTSDRRKRLCLLVGLMCIVSLLSSAGLHLQAQKGAEDPTWTGSMRTQWIDPILVSLEPSQVRVEPGQTVTLDIRVHDVIGLGGYQYKMHFDAHVLAVEDQGVRPGIQIAAGDVFSGRDTLEPLNLADNATGVLTYAMTIMSSTDAPFDGSGSLGRVTFRGVTTGVSSVWFDLSPGYHLLGYISRTHPISNGNAIPSLWGQALVAVGVDAQRICLPLALR